MATRPSGRSPRAVVIAAWAVPVMIVGQFAMLALVPLLVVVAGAWRDARLRPLRPFAAALALAYAVPLAAWAIGPDRAPSLSKDMHPALAVVVVAVAAAFLVVLHRALRRPAVPMAGAAGGAGEG